MLTMDQEYGDESPHECCQTCGMCRTCGDCECFGCGGDNNPNGIKDMEENNEKSSEVFPREIIMADGDYICPVCNQGKMILTGRKTLGFPVDRKAYCPLCLHEEEF